MPGLNNGFYPCRALLHLWGFKRHTADYVLYKANLISTNLEIFGVQIILLSSKVLSWCMVDLE